MYRQKNYSNSPIIFLPVILFSIVMFFFISNNSKDKEDKYDTYTEATQATVTYYNIDKVRSKGGAYHYYHDLTFEFIVNNKKYVVVNTYEGPENSISSVGGKISIHYDKNNPNNAIPDSFREYEKTSDDSVKKYFIILIVATILIALYSFSKNKNNKSVGY